MIEKFGFLAIFACVAVLAILGMSFAIRRTIAEITNGQWVRKLPMKIGIVALAILLLMVFSVQTSPYDRVVAFIQGSREITALSGANPLVIPYQISGSWTPEFGHAEYSSYIRGGARGMTVHVKLEKSNGVWVITSAETEGRMLGIPSMSPSHP